MIRQKKITINHTIFNHYLKAYINNIIIASFNSECERNTAKEISISTKVDLADTNHSRMEHLSISATFIELKEPVIDSAQLGNKTTAETN